MWTLNGDPLLLLLLASALVVVSHLFDALARVSRVPSVLLLLGLGVGLRLAADAAGLALPLPAPLIIILGTLGLILIVLEGALELSLEKEKWPLIRRAGGAALLVLVLMALVLALLLVLALDVPLRTALLNAIPFAVISSAIAIPASSGFDPAKREFIVYESTFSDILGIMLFTALLPSPYAGSVAWQLGNLLGVLALAAIGSLLLMLMVEKITTHIKFFMILAVLVGAYVVAKQLHLSALLLVLVFGLLLNNGQIFDRFPLRGLVDRRRLRREVRQFRVIVLESAFLVRTFFFVAFGFYLNMGGIAAAGGRGHGGGHHRHHRAGPLFAPAACGALPAFAGTLHRPARPDHHIALFADSRRASPAAAGAGNGIFRGRLERPAHAGGDDGLEETGGIA